MALKAYQQEAELNTLYEIKKKGGVSGSELIEPSLWSSNGGLINIYDSCSKTVPTTILEMTLLTENSNLPPGTIAFAASSVYIAITQVSGTTTEINTQGMELIDLGPIS